MTYAVILPVYNSVGTVAASITSLVSQSVAPTQIIIVDDASRDSSGRICSAFAEAYPFIEYIRLAENRGVAHARNVGLEHVKTEYIAFCDSDDLWVKNKMEVQLEELKNNLDCAGVFSNRIICGNRNLKTYRSECPEKVAETELLVRNYVTFSSFVVRSELVGDELRFTAYRHEDYIFLVTLLRKSNSFFLNTGTYSVIYKVHANNLTANKLYSLGWHLKAQRILGLSYKAICQNFLLNIYTRIRGK